MERTIFSAIWTFPRRTVVLLITLYQHTLSPDHGPLKALFPHGYCPHFPTCSEYSKQILMKRGLLIGSMLAFWRVLSCNPWAKPSNERLQRLAAKQ